MRRVALRRTPRAGATPQLTRAESYAMRFEVLGFPAGGCAATRVRPGDASDRRPGVDASFRAARASVGLPVGVQVAAPPSREDTVLRVMAALERQHRRDPDYPGREAVPLQWSRR